MSEVQPAKPGPDLLKWAIRGAALIGVAAVLYVIVSASIKPKSDGDLRQFAKGELVKLVAPATPTPPPTTPFTDADCKLMTLADFKGQVVVVNLWASWCAPCKLEMPTLARLQATYQAYPVKVVPISVDKDVDLNLAKADIAANSPLKLYRDPGYKFAFGLKPVAQGFPTTIIYDKQGRERARLSGDADWSGKEARGLIDALLKE